VELRGIRLTLDGRVVLRNVNWTVRAGEGWRVTGPNGAGKTSLMRILTGRQWPDAGPRGGERRYFFDRQATASPIGLTRHIAWLSPELHRRFARLETPLTAGDIMLTGFAGTLLLTEPPNRTQRAAAQKLAKTHGALAFWRRPFAELSQGQQRLVLLVRALVLKPRLLVLDEFSDGLDEANLRRITRALIRCRRAGCAVVVATHRAADDFAGLSHHLHLQAGRVLTGKVPEKKSPTLRPATGLPEFNIPTNPPKKGRKSTFRLANAAVAIGDHARVTRILHEINWTVYPGENWAVLGPNGCGKSTLLRTIYGELSVAHGGMLERFGRDAVALPLPAARRRMGFVSPALQHLYEADVSVAEVVASGFQASVGLLQQPTAAEFKQAQLALRSLGIAKLAARRWGTLSFGEARLALLARALVPRPKLLLLDEPCDGLAPAARARLLGLVDRAVQRGAQVVIAAHRREDLPACINRVLRLKHGRIVQSTS